MYNTSGAREAKDTQNNQKVCAVAAQPEDNNGLIIQG